MILSMTFLFNLNDDDYAERQYDADHCCARAREAQRFWQIGHQCVRMYLLTGIE